MVLGAASHTDLAVENLTHFDFPREVLGPLVGRATSLFLYPSFWIDGVDSLLVEPHRHNALVFSPYVDVLESEA